MKQRTFIRIHGSVPTEFFLACSGGPDSMAALDFLTNNRSDRKVTPVFFHHNTDTSSRSLDLLLKFSKDRSLPLELDGLSREKDKDESLEEYWRNERLRFFYSLQGPVVTAHNLDDAIETWIFTSLHGKPSLIPYQNRNVIRPFLLTEKSTLLSWCARRGIPFYNDPSNQDVHRFTRAWIRYKIIPAALQVNPGLRKTVRKLILSNFGESYYVDHRRNDELH